MLTTILATIFVIGLLVVVHEFGHFATAKLVGMRVDEFAVGFGPKLFSLRRGETLYALRAVPLGGFVRIAGMDPDEEQDEHSYQRKPIWARMLVIAAGSVMNFVLPVVLFLLVLLTSGIDMPSDQPVVGGLIENRPAAMAGIVAGDRIVAVDGTPIGSWRQFVETVKPSAGKPLTIKYERSGVAHTAVITPELDAKSGRGIIGITPEIFNRRPGLGEAVGLAFKQTYLVVVAMIVGIGQMITGQAPADVAGPIGVAQMAGQVAQLGIMPLLQFAAFLSINLGLINLLPVPVLDGGHLVTLAVEAVRGKPLGRDQLQFIQMIGFTLLMLLMLLATFKDVVRLKLLDLL